MVKSSVSHQNCDISMLFMRAMEPSTYGSIDGDFVRKRNQHKIRSCSLQ